jgi:hypothetical protein
MPAPRLRVRLRLLLSFFPGAFIRSDRDTSAELRSH